MKIEITALVKTLQGFFNTVKAWFSDLPAAFFTEKSKQTLAEGKTYTEVLHEDHDRVTLALNRYGFHNTSAAADKMENTANSPVITL